MSRNINGDCSLEVRAGIPIAVIGNWYIMVGGEGGGAVNSDGVYPRYDNFGIHRA